MDDSWMIPILEVVNPIALWVIPIVTLILLCTPNDHEQAGMMKLRLVLAAAAAMVWVIFISDKIDIMQGDSGVSMKDAIADIALIALVPTALTMILYLTFWQVALAGGAVGCVAPVFFLGFMVVLGLLTFYFGPIIAPAIWIITVLILLGGADFSSFEPKSGNTGSGNDPGGNPPYTPPYTPPVTTPYTPVHVEEHKNGGTGSTDTPQKSGHWEEKKVWYTDYKTVEYTEQVQVPVEVITDEPYEVMEEKEERRTEWHRYLVLSGEANAMTLKPEQTPYLMSGMKWASLSGAADDVVTMLFALKNLNKGGMWWVMNMPGDHEVTINGTGIKGAATLTAGMKLGIRKTDGTPMGELQLSIENHAMVVTRMVPKKVWRTKKVKRTEYRTETRTRTKTVPVDKYRIERVWVA